MVGLAGTATATGRERRNKLGAGETSPLPFRKHRAYGGEEGLVADGTLGDARERVRPGTGGHRGQMHPEVGGDARDGPVDNVGVRLHI